MTKRKTRTKYYDTTAKNNYTSNNSCFVRPTVPAKKVVLYREQVNTRKTGIISKVVIQDRSDSQTRDYCSHAKEFKPPQLIHRWQHHKDQRVIMFRLQSLTSSALPAHAYAYACVFVCVCVCQSVGHTCTQSHSMSNSFSIHHRG